MKQLRHTFAVLLIIYTLAVPAAAQRVELLREEGGAVENPPESLQLEYKFKPGDIAKYDITLTGEGMVKFPGQEDQVKLEARTNMRCVRSVSAQIPSDGIWRIEWDTIKATMLIPEFGEVFITVPHMEYEMDKRGKVKKLKGLDELAVCPGLPQQKTLGDILGQLPAGGFPDKEIKVGDSWEDAYEILLPEQKPVKVKVTSKLEGFERIKEMDCAKILTTYETPFMLDANKLKSSDDASAAKGDEKSVPLSGTEKGEFWTYFAYKEGTLLQVYGSVELKADNTAKPKPEGPEPTGEESVEVKGKRHDIYVKYQLVSLLFTGKDENEEASKQ